MTVVEQRGGELSSSPDPVVVVVDADVGDGSFDEQEDVLGHAFRVEGRSVFVAAALFGVVYIVLTGLLLWGTQV